jgi:predicted transcriptional regulator
MALSLVPPGGEPPKKKVKDISVRRMNRIKQVQDLFLSGLKKSEIAQRFGISQRMVELDLQDGRQNYQEVASQVDQHETIGKQVTLLLKCQWLAMRDYQKFMSESNKVGALRLVGEFHTKLMTLLQTTGLVREVPKTFILDDFNPFEDEEFTEKFDTLILEARAKGIKIFGL